MAKRLISCIVSIMILMLLFQALFAQVAPPSPPVIPGDGADETVGPPPPPPDINDPGPPPTQVPDGETVIVPGAEGPIPGQDSGAPPSNSNIPGSNGQPGAGQANPNAPGAVPGQNTQPGTDAGIPPAPANDMNIPEPPAALSPEGEITVPGVENVTAVLFGPGKNWTMFKGDAAHTGYTQELLTYPPKLAWKYLTELSTNNQSSPAVADGIVYFCSGRCLYAISADTGALKWRYPAVEPLSSAIKSSPLVGDDLIYFGGGDGKFYAITKETGTQAWSFASKGKGAFNSSPTLADGVIYIGSTDDTLYALDARTGQPKWPGGFRTRDDISCAPAVVGGLVYFLSNDMMLYAAHTSTGKIKWCDRVGASSGSSSPVVSDNTVYIAAGNVMQARQAKSGRLKWGVQISSDISTVPAVAGGAIYFGCKNGKVYALTSAGKLKWAKPVDMGAPIYGSPIVANDTVIIGNSKGLLMAIDVKTGQPKWTYKVQPSLLNFGRLKYVNIGAAPVVSNGTLYVLVDDGALHAFRCDVPDAIPPQASTVVPARDSLMPGAPPIQIAAIVSDQGSGVNMNTVTLLLDDQPVKHELIPERGIVWYKTPVTQPIDPLDDGLHTVTLQLSDWAGNKLETKWCFTVDNRIKRAVKSAPQTGTNNPGGAAPSVGPRPGT